VIVGRQDALTPPEVAEEIVEGIARSSPEGGEGAGRDVGRERVRLALIEDCGHLAPMERPQAVTALLRDWLTYAF
jgi:pimeloyl-ACP methyl ester carboxylesterase